MSALDNLAITASTASAAVANDSDDSIRVTCRILRRDTNGRANLASVTGANGINATAFNVTALRGGAKTTSLISHAMDEEEKELKEDLAALPANTSNINSALSSRSVSPIEAMSVSEGSSIVDIGAVLLSSSSSTSSPPNDRRNNAPDGESLSSSSSSSSLSIVSSSRGRSPNTARRASDRVFPGDASYQDEVEEDKKPPTKKAKKEEENMDLGPQIGDLRHEKEPSTYDWMRPEDSLNGTQATHLFAPSGFRKGGLDMHMAHCLSYPTPIEEARERPARLRINDYYVTEDEDWMILIKWTTGDSEWVPCSKCEQLEKLGKRSRKATDRYAYGSSARPIKIDDDEHNNNGQSKSSLKSLLQESRRRPLNGTKPEPVPQNELHSKEKVRTSRPKSSPKSKRNAAISTVNGEERMFCLRRGSPRLTVSAHKKYFKKLLYSTTAVGSESDDEDSSDSDDGLLVRIQSEPGNTSESSCDSESDEEDEDDSDSDSDDDLRAQLEKCRDQLQAKEAENQALKKENLALKNRNQGIEERSESLEEENQALISRLHEHQRKGGFLSTSVVENVPTPASKKKLASNCKSGQKARPPKRMAALEGDVVRRRNFLNSFWVTFDNNRQSDAEGAGVIATRKIVKGEKFQDRATRFIKKSPPSGLDPFRYISVGSKQCSMGHFTLENTITEMVNEPMDGQVANIEWSIAHYKEEGHELRRVLQWTVIQDIPEGAEVLVKYKQL